ncbi:flagellar basal body P-ring formation protein FlgA [Mangrovimicrobium sediminis]|uniref:Flagella basal body P-ring formation protein FlgA n=1 Tax=Mangrovimicrobium sediminis TaxID=2562682 RepID=A0A4Z0M0K0_9GAMM|nr:flagellar basal body P-ring formation chaperone FlgA [Haliea sp. SAOS-164]TGD73132.1 flagellar basal body P-ring formation protein FlgA [Haliea sp. SAOS-164]
MTRQIFHRAIPIASFTCWLLAGAWLAPAVAETADSAAGRAAVAAVEERFANLGDSLQVTVLDTRHDLEQCAQPDAFLRNTAISRSGRLYVGVHCQGEREQTLYLQVQLRVQGSYLVAGRDIAAGTLISADMLEPREGDLTPLLGEAVLHPEDAVGRVARRNLTAGSVLRSRNLETFMLVARGQPVFFDVVGSGFRITGKGEALEAGNPGETIRIRTESRKTLSGVVSNRGTVQVAL